MTPINKKALEDLYKRYNRREFVHPDPLEFLYNYDSAADREIAGLIASSLAYGRVAQILKSVSSVLDKLTPSPVAYIEKTRPAKIDRDFRDFKHRFTTGEELSGMLRGIKSALKKHGSLESCFLSFTPESCGLQSALAGFVACVNTQDCGGSCGSLLPAPERGSACKRLNLYLRWMSRKDDVDPGGWDGVNPSQLIIPLDTHMYRIGSALGFTSRKQADLRTAIEITDAFRTISPADPVRYDFCLTRLGIRSDTSLDDFLAKYRYM